jgi:formylmethanofuran dehydrogenase subunit E
LPTWLFFPKEFSMKIKSEHVSFEEVAGFHGHACPGLAIGYRAALKAMELMESKRAAGGELAAIAENNSCAVDAVQYITGCTAGKGNLIVKNQGKFVFTFFNMMTGISARIYVNIKDAAPEMAQLSPDLPDEENVRLRKKALTSILQATDDELFEITEPQLPAPPPAVIEPSIPCKQCGELTMKSKGIMKDNNIYCWHCAEKIL